MDDHDLPKIEFPCRYPIKVIGTWHGAFRADVLRVVRRHDPRLVSDDVDERLSRRGRFVSLTVNMTATGEAQLQDLFADLKALDAVSLVL